MIKNTIAIFFFMALSTLNYGQQGFTGTAVAGINTSQIDGDNLTGFSKLGWSGGVKIGYPIRHNSDASIELLFNQKGSNNGAGFGDKSEGYINLNYLEVPFIINIQDWYVADGDYHKAKAHCGLSTGYLFGITSTFTEFSENVDLYNKVDLSYILGASFYFNEHVGITARYTRSLSNLTNISTIPGSPKTISYFWTFRTEYKF